MGRHPLIGLAVSVGIGTAVGLSGFLPAPVLLVSALFGLLAQVLFRRQEVIGSLTVHFTVLVLAGANAATVVRSPSVRDLDARTGADREFVRAVGYVANDPAVSEDGREAILYTVRLEALQRLQRFERVRGAVRVPLDPLATEKPLRYGDRLYLEGVLSITPARPGSLGKSLPFLYPVEERTGLLPGRSGFMLQAMCYDARRSCAAVLRQGLEAYPSHVGLLKALILGYSDALPKALRDTFSATGTLHIFAISGLHVGVVAAFLDLLLNAFGLTRKRRVLVIGPLLVVYTMLTGLKVSAVRACVMAICFGLAFLFQRKPDGFSSLSLAALLILSFAPMQLVDPGFIYSFAIVAGLLLAYRPLVSFVDRLYEGETWDRPQPATAGPLGTDIRRYILGLAVTSVIAWICSAPLTARFFNMVSPVALLGNLFVIPAAFLILLTGSLSMVLGLFSSVLAEVFNHANRIFISTLLAGIDFLAAIPFGRFSIISPPWIAIGAWYVAWLVAAFSRGIKRWLVPPVLLGALLVLFTASLFTGPAKISVHHEGGRHITLVDGVGIRDLLIDATPWAWERLLRRQGINRLHALVLTQPDSVRIEGAVQLLQAIPVGEIWMPARQESRDQEDVLLKEAARRGVAVRRLERGQRGELGRRLEWEVITSTGSLSLRFLQGASSLLVVDTWDTRLERKLEDLDVELGHPVVIIGRTRSRGAYAFSNVLHPVHVILPATRQFTALYDRLRERDTPVSVTYRGERVDMLMRQDGLRLPRPAGDETVSSTPW